jgi:uracil-DNA glycosylase family 4
MSESANPETPVHPQVASKEVTLLNNCARLRVPPGKEFGCRSCPLFQYAKCFTKQDEAAYQASFDKLNPVYLEKAIKEAEERHETLVNQMALGADIAGVVADAHDELTALRTSLDQSEEEWPKKQNNLYMAEPVGPLDADVMVVFESPTGPEDRAKKSFEGGAARLVRKRLIEAGLKPDRMRFTYLARCRPPKEADWKVASRCQRFLADEIRKVQPKIIIAFGALVTGVLVGKDDVSIQHYATVAQRAVVCGRQVDIFPMLAPGYILRNDWMAPKYVQHFEALAKFVRGESAVLEDKSTYEVITDPDRAIEVCKELLEQVEAGKVLDCDIETSGLSPYKQGMRFSVMSLCVHVSKSYAVMFDHDECPWSDEDRQRVISEGFKPLMTHPTAKLRWHNGKFDVRWVKHMLGFWPRDQFEDTMLSHYAMDENMLHGLKALALMYTDMGDYDEELDRYLATQDVPDRPRYDLVPLNLLGKYAAFDTLATRKLSRALRKESERQDVHIRSLAYRVMPAISAACARLEHAGMCIDLEYAKKIAMPHLKREEEKSLAAVMKDPIVRQFIRDKEAGKRAKMKKPKPIELKRYFEFSLDSPKQMQELLYGERYYHHEVTVLSESGAPSTDKEAMTELIKAGSPIAKALQEYRLDQKLRATYAEPVVQKCEEQGDNLLHVSILAHGTVTGRAATRDPNLQSTPNKGASVIKRMFVSRFGEEGCIVQFDYSQIELRILAAVSGDPRMIAAYENGEDLHTIAACMIFGTTVEEHKALPKDEQKRRRTVAKRINFGIAYGIGAPGIQHSLKADGVMVTVEEAKGFLETFYSKFPRVGKWIERVEASTEDDFYSRSLFGRRRRLEQVRSYDKDTKSAAKRQAVNHVIQSTAADFTWTSLILMDQEICIRSGRNPAMILPTIDARQFPVDKRWRDVSIVLQVHDSILCDCPLSMAGEVVDMFHRTMPHVVDLAPLVWGPEVVPLLKPMRKVKPEVDGEVGTSWRDAYKVKTGADVPLAMHVARVKRAKLDADVTYKWGDEDDKAAKESFKC